MIALSSHSHPAQPSLSSHSPQLSETRLLALEAREAAQEAALAMAKAQLQAERAEWQAKMQAEREERTCTSTSATSYCIKHFLNLQINSTHKGHQRTPRTPGTPARGCVSQAGSGLRPCYAEWLKLPGATTYCEECAFALLPCQRSASSAWHPHLHRWG